MIHSSEIPSKAKVFLSLKDQKFKTFVTLIQRFDQKYEPDYFKGLLKCIVYQQLSTRAADSIWKNLCNNIKNISPKTIASYDEKDLKMVGLSSNKVVYIKNLADFFRDHSVLIKAFDELPNETISNELLKIKGIGQWSVNMFLMFTLKRSNILPLNDLGIKKALEWTYPKWNHHDYQSFKKYFAPYGSYAAMYLWEVNKMSSTYKSIDFLLGERFLDYYESPVGLLEIIGDQEGLLEINFVKQKAFLACKNHITQKTMDQLAEYFTGDRKTFNLPIKMPGTDFQKSVWEALLTIDYGKTLSYKAIAVKINNPKACRAVGNANNKNKIPIVVPCHRVVGSNNNLGGYAAGLKIKKWLLNLEKKES